MAYKPSDRAGVVFGELRKLGYPEHVAAALTGNIIQESGHKLRSDAVGDGGAAYGMVQWNGPRKRAYLRWAEANGFDPADTKAQVRYLDHELKTTERGARDAIMKAPTLEDATRIASDRFWRPGVPMMNNRLRYAAGVMNNYGGGVVNVADTGDARREALMQEARRRGLVKDGGTGGKTRREMLMEEARRRGLIQNDAEDAARIQEKAAIESAVGQVLGETAPKGGTAEPIQDPGLMGVRMTAEPDAVVSPTDLLRVSPPGMLIAEIKRHLPEKLQNALDQVVKGSSFNWSDEMTGAANAALSGTEGETFGQEYKRFADAERARAEQFRETDPALAVGSEITGALATAPLFGPGVAATTGTGARVAAGAAEGAFAGSLAGSGDATGDARLEGAIKGGAGGAIMGAALSRLGIGVERFINKRSAMKAVMAPEDMKKVAGEMIEEAERMGLAYRPEAAVSFGDDLVRTMREESMTKGVDDVALAAYREIVKSIENGTPVTLKQVAKWEAMAFRAMKKAKRMDGGEPSERHLAVLVDKLRAFADDEANMALGRAGTPEELAEMLRMNGGSGAVALRREGAKLWGQWRRWNRLEKVFETAKLDTRGNKVSDLEGTVRQAFKAFYKKEANLTGFSAAERKLIRDIAYRGVTTKTLQQFAKLSPEGSGLMMYLQVIGVGTGAGPATIPAGVAGFFAKRLADYRATKQVKDVLAQVLSGKPLTKETLDAMTTAEQQQIANFFLRGSASRYGEDVGEAVGADKTGGFLRNLAGTGIEP